MALSVRRFAGAEDHAVARNLWQLFSHDLAEFRGTLPDAAGRYLETRLRPFLEDTVGDQIGYLARQGGDPVGFALVRDALRGPRGIMGFFVVRPVRRSGVGRELALDVLARHPRAWEIAFQEENPGAARFWRDVAQAAFGDDWHEERRPVPDRPGRPPDCWVVAE